MNERNKLLESIADTIRDYRAGEIPEPTPGHVDRWVKQFDENAQAALLGEIDHVLKKTYFSRKTMSEWFGQIITKPKLGGAFWETVRFLKLQPPGHSQDDVLKLFDEGLVNQYGVQARTVNENADVFVYLDDVLFTGNRVKKDVGKWIWEAPPTKTLLYIVTFATHTLGEWQVRSLLMKEAAMAGKSISIQHRTSRSFENRLMCNDTSDVLWPATLPDNPDLQSYVAQERNFPFKPRDPGQRSQAGVFSSEGGRQLLERELLLAGVHIRAGCRDPDLKMRPLGFSRYGLGFGSMIVTYRNCPNNCPLALWWGDPEAKSGHLHWYPLLPRKTYAQHAIEPDDPEQWYEDWDTDPNL